MIEELATQILEALEAGPLTIVDLLLKYKCGIAPLCEALYELENKEAIKSHEEGNAIIFELWKQ